MKNLSEPFFLEENTIALAHFVLFGLKLFISHIFQLPDISNSRAFRWAGTGAQCPDFLVLAAVQSVGSRYRFFLHGRLTLCQILPSFLELCSDICENYHWSGFLATCYVYSFLVFGNLLWISLVLCSSMPSFPVLGCVCFCSIERRRLLFAIIDFGSLVLNGISKPFRNVKWLFDRVIPVTETGHIFGRYECSCRQSNLFVGLFFQFHIRSSTQIKKSLGSEQLRFCEDS